MPEPVPAYQGVLDFWFGPPPHATRTEWFRKDPAFDTAIQARFGATIAQALAGGFGEWCLAPHGALARVIVLDQFTRNTLRDTAAAFSGDARALATAEAALDAGFDRALDPFERVFLYMPFEHSEALAQQDRGVALFTALAAEAPAVQSNLDYAHKHRDVIARFGRFPHRNRLLGRVSTPEEIAFLQTPGSSF
jgi:uncharacterized protein (DUF924 family)